MRARYLTCAYCTLSPLRNTRREPPETANKLPSITDGELRVTAGLLLHSCEHHSSMFWGGYNPPPPPPPDPPRHTHTHTHNHTHTQTHTITNPHTFHYDIIISVDGSLGRHYTVCRYKIPGNILSPQDYDSQVMINRRLLYKNCLL